MYTIKKLRPLRALRTMQMPRHVRDDARMFARLGWGLSLRRLYEREVASGSFYSRRH